MALYSMRKNIIALLNHCVKAENPAKRNRFCPFGETSWGKWQQDQASGTSTYKDDDRPDVFLSYCTLHYDTK